MSNIKNLKPFIQANQERFLFVIIVILIAIISFKAGEMREKEKKSADLKVILNNQVERSSKEKRAIALGEAIQRKNLTEVVENQTKIIGKNEKQCQFVGSKNSDKYHVMSCRWAEQIKPENRVCFKSVEEAKEMGYQPASCNK